MYQRGTQANQQSQRIMYLHNTINKTIENHKFIAWDYLHEVISYIFYHALYKLYNKIVDMHTCINHKHTTIAYLSNQASWKLWKIKNFPLAKRLNLFLILKNNINNNQSLVAYNFPRLSTNPKPMQKYDHLPQLRAPSHRGIMSKPSPKSNNLNSKA